jgi:hypothetical protein
MLKMYWLDAVCGITAGQGEGEHLCCRCIGYTRYVGSLRARVKGSIYVVDIWLHVVCGISVGQGERGAYML